MINFSLGFKHRIRTLPDSNRLNQRICDNAPYLPKQFRLSAT